MNERCDAMESNPSSCNNLISGSSKNNDIFTPKDRQPKKPNIKQLKQYKKRRIDSNN